MGLNLMINPCAWHLSDLKKVKPNGIKVMSTFACGGGSTMGYKLLGCEVVAANDIDKEMAYHYRLNHNPKYYYLCPIKNLLNIDLPQELFNLDILDGSPPCSSFSVAGSREKVWGKKKKFREGQAHQVLDDLFFDYLNLVDRLKPKVSIAENVKGLITGKAKGYVKMIFDRYRKIGYRPQLFLVNAADCGVPQKRERVFFVALRNDIDKPRLTLNPAHRWISAGEATSDLQELTDKEIKDTKPTNTDLKYWKYTKKGKDYSDAVKRIKGKESYFSHYRIDETKPSNTLIANHWSMKHWDVCRRLTYRESIRLGSFPEDYKAKTPSIGKYIIGMSVPPLMMKEVAKAVIEQWLN